MLLVSKFYTSEETRKTQQISQGSLDSLVQKTPFSVNQLMAFAQ